MFSPSITLTPFAPSTNMGVMMAEAFDITVISAFTDAVAKTALATIFKLVPRSIDGVRFTDSS